MNSAIERLLSLRVMDVMSKRVVTMSPDQSMADAATALIEKKVSGAPVVDKDGRCVGILSATDFMHSIRGDTSDSETESWVRSHMTATVQTIARDATIMQAARLMCAEHIHRLPVVEGDKQVVGWVSSLDIVAALVNAIEE